MYPSIRAGGAVNAAGATVDLSAFNNDTPRTNFFNQNDFTYKFATGPLAHTLLAGFELGKQEGIPYREEGFFATTGTQTLTVNPLSPVSRVPVSFRNLASSSNSRYGPRTGCGLRPGADRDRPPCPGDRWPALRSFRFLLDDRRTNVTNSRIDDLLSPRVGLVFKPVDSLAFYGNYSISYLPSAGDQFSALSEGLAIAEPERFENREVGVKWDVSSTLQLTGALYDLDRFNQRLAIRTAPASSC